MIPFFSVPHRRDLRIRACTAICLSLMLAAAAAAQSSELLIRNGLIVNATGRMQGDVRIRAGKIAEIGKGLAPGPGAQIIDAKGKLVLPGAVDPHVHLTPVRTPTTMKGADDYTTGGRSALAGGKTTIGNFINQKPGESAEKTLTDAAEVVRRQAVSDVILHYVVSDPTKFTPADVPVLSGRATLKIFLMRPGFDQNATDYVKLIAAAGKAGILSMLHCEDSSIIAETQQRLIAEGRGALKGQNYFDSRPVVSEEVATVRGVGISEATGAPIYIVHMSSERAMRAAEAGRSRGLPVYTEVRFLYLHWTKEQFNRRDGAIFVGAPPLREKSDLNYLWGSVAKGSADVVDTDHVGYTRDEKLDPKLTVVNMRAAGNYLQIQLPLMYSEGVRAGRITLEKMVAVSSANPAKLFGLYPRKGVIAAGSDADIVIWDPNLTKKVRDEDELGNGKFNIANGRTLTGWPIITIRRGEVVYKDGKVLAAAGSGQLAPRRHWEKPL